MIKILHTADIHLDSPLKTLALRHEGLRETVQAATRDAFIKLVDYALSESVAAMLISGDLFDGKARSAKTGAFLIRQFERLRSAGIQVFYIKGNHDAENPMSGEIDLPGNVHIFGGRGGKVQLGDTNVWVHGVSFSGKYAPESLLKYFSAPVSEAVNIAMLHTSLAGASGHDPYAPCTVAELSKLGFDYWALGHIHKRAVHRETPWVVMPGIPQGRDIGELGSKSATVLSIDDGQISVDEVVTSAVEFLVHDIDVSTAHTDDQLRSLLLASINTLAAGLASPAAIVRFRLIGQTSRRWQITRDSDYWKEALTEFATDTQCLWVEQMNLELQDPSDAPDNDGASGELLALMGSIQSESAFMEYTFAEVESLLSQLSASQRKALVPDEDAMQELCRSLISSGSDYLYALMKGATE